MVFFLPLYGRPPMMILAGFAIGTLGTLVGAGGGVILVPLLLYLYPEAPSTWIGGISMGMISLNATSGSISYYFKKTIHLPAAGVFIAAGIPGGVLGVAMEHYIDRPLFEKIFGVAMILIGGVLMVRKKRDATQVTSV